MREIYDYSSLSEEEKRVYKEYKTWAKSDAPIACRLAMMNIWRQRLEEMGVWEWVVSLNSTRNNKEI